MDRQLTQDLYNNSQHASNVYNVATFGSGSPYGGPTYTYTYTVPTWSDLIGTGRSVAAILEGPTLVDVAEPVKVAVEAPDVDEEYFAMAAKLGINVGQGNPGTDREVPARAGHGAVRL